MRPALAVLCGSLALVWLLAALGVTGAIDRDVRRLSYVVRGDRPATADVILVAIDDATADRWGPPPWPWQRYRETIGAIAAGHPRLIAVLDPGPRALPAAPLPPDLSALVARGTLIVSPATDALPQPGVVLDDHGAVEAIDLGGADLLGGPSVARQVIERAGLPSPAGDRLPVNFFGAGRGFPTLPAGRIAAGEIPPRTFAGRIVVIGMRGPRFAPEVPTPVGPLSPAEVEAQALHALATGAALRDAPAWLAPLLVLAFALFGLLVPPRPASSLATAGAVAGLSLASVVADHLLFAHLDLRVGLAAPLAGLIVAAGGSLLFDRARVHRELGELAALAAQRISLSNQERGALDDQAFWQRFATATSAYLHSSSAFLAQLERGAWHLDIVQGHLIAPADIVERRRDIRRDPYRRAYLTRRPAWAERPFVKPELGVKTLMVPLGAWRRLLGMWVVQFPAGAEVGERELRLCQLFAAELVYTLEQRRLGRLLGPGGVAGEPGALPSRLVDDAMAARDSALALAHAQAVTSRVLDALPVGVLTATLWGEVVDINQAMRRFLGQVGAEPGPRPDLAELLAAVTHGAPGEVRSVLAQLLDQGGSVRLEARVAQTLGPDALYDVVVSRLASDSGDGARESRAVGHSHFAVTASERRPAPAAEIRWSWHADASDVALPVDVQALVAEAVAEVQRGATARRPLLVESPDVLPPVVVGEDDLRQALAAVVAEWLAQGPADVPGKVVVEDEGDAVLVRIIDPVSTLPAADVDRLSAPAGAESTGGEPDSFDPGSPLYRLSRARRQVERARGGFAIETGLDRGTVIELRLPVAGRPRRGSPGADADVRDAPSGMTPTGRSGSVVGRPKR